MHPLHMYISARVLSRKIQIVWLILLMFSVWKTNAQGIEQALLKLREAQAQEPSIDRDSMLAMQFSYLAEAYSGGQDSLALLYIDSLAQLKDAGKWKKTTGLWHRAIGKYHDRRGEFEKALDAYTDAITAFAKENDQTDLTAYTYILKAFVLNNNGLHEACGAMLEEIKPLAERLENKNYLAWILDWYGDQQFYSAYGHQNFEAALAHYQQVEAILPHVRSRMIQADNAHGLAGCYIRLGQEDKANTYRQKALEIARAHQLHSVIFAVYGDMADVYEARGDFPNAIEYRLLGLDYAKQTHWIEMEARAHRTTFYTFKAAGDYKQALDHFEQWKVIEDSLDRFNVQQAYHDLEARYELGKKDLQIEQLKARNLRMYLYILAALLASGVLFLLYYRQTNKKLLHQNLALSQKNQEIRRALTEGQNIERKRMAIELHDNVNAKIAAAKWILETINTPDKSPEEQAAINRVVEAMADIYEDVRFISHNLVPKDIETKPLSQIFTQLIENLNRNQKIAFRYEHVGADDMPNHDLKIQAYAMVMELINNIIRHSECSTAQIRMEIRPEALEIEVRDDGKGFIPGEVRTGTGLKNLESRVQGVHGELRIQSNGTRGVQVQIRIPIPA